MISLIIPTLNEERALPQTLACVALQGSPHEIIVADGGSSDGTVGIARNAGVQCQCISAPRGRGPQMNAGAHLARGEWLLFLHADTLLPPDALAAIEALPPAVEAGCFHQAFSHDHWLLRAVSRLHNWRCKRTRIMYGDQAMFVRRSVFEALGGFPDGDLEDVKLSERLRARGARHAPVALPAVVVTDARKFLAHGIVRSTARVVLILLCHRYRLPLAGRRFFEAVR